MSDEQERTGTMEDDPVASGPVEEVVEEKPGPDERLWDPDGPTSAKIEEWKVDHGDLYVTSVTPERHYVWRTLKRSEYRNLVQMLEKKVEDGMSQALANMDNEEAVAELCILEPKYVRQEPGHMAGVASIIAQEVMEASGFVAVDVRSL